MDREAKGSQAIDTLEYRRTESQRQQSIRLHFVISLGILIVPLVFAIGVVGYVARLDPSATVTTDVSTLAESSINALRLFLDLYTKLLIALVGALSLFVARVNYGRGQAAHNRCPHAPSQARDRNESDGLAEDDQTQDAHIK